MIQMILYERKDIAPIIWQNNAVRNSETVADVFRSSRISASSLGNLRITFEADGLEKEIPVLVGQNSGWSGQYEMIISTVTGNCNVSNGGVITAIDQGNSATFSLFVSAFLAVECSVTLQLMNLGPVPGYMLSNQITIQLVGEHNFGPICEVSDFGAWSDSCTCCDSTIVERIGLQKASAAERNLRESVGKWAQIAKVDLMESFGHTLRLVTGEAEATAFTMRIAAYELMKAAQALSLDNFRDSACSAMIDRLDSNSDGVLSYEEARYFIGKLAKKTTPVYGVASRPGTIGTVSSSRVNAISRTSAITRSTTTSRDPSTSSEACVRTRTITSIAPGRGEDDCDSFLFALEGVGLQEHAPCRTEARFCDSGNEDPPAPSSADPPAGPPDDPLTPDEPDGECFPEDAMIMMADGSHKKMLHLGYFDKVATIHSRGNGEYSIKSSPVVAFSHKDANSEPKGMSKVDFIEVHVLNNASNVRKNSTKVPDDSVVTGLFTDEEELVMKLSLTPNHLVPIVSKGRLTSGKPEFISVAAERITVGMQLITVGSNHGNGKVFSPNSVTSSGALSEQAHDGIAQYGTVIQVVRKTRYGTKLFAPHTLPNNIVVDGVVVSCSTNGMFLASVHSGIGGPVHHPAADTFLQMLLLPVHIGANMLSVLGLSFSSIL